MEVCYGEKKTAEGRWMEILEDFMNLKNESETIVALMGFIGGDAKFKNRKKS